MKRTLTSIFTALLLSVAFIGCKNAEQRAAEIIAAKEQAEAQAKLEAEIAKLKAATEANEKARENRETESKRKAEDAERNDIFARAQAELAKATADAKRAQADAQKAQADAAARTKALADAEAAAKRGKADAEANRKLAELKDAAARADAAAASARASAALAAELNRQLKLDLAKAKAGGGNPGGGNFGAGNPPAIAPAGTTLVGKSGGKVRSPGGSGATINIPPGSVKANTPMTINVVPPPAVGKGKKPVCAVACTPHGAVFNPPVQVIFPIGHSKFPAGKKLALTFWNAKLQRYEDPKPTILATVSSKNRGFAIALVPHFSDLVLVEPSRFEEAEAPVVDVVEYDPDSDIPEPDPSDVNTDVADERGAFPPHSPTEGEDESDLPAEEDPALNPTGEYSPDYAPDESEGEEERHEEDGHPDFPRHGGEEQPDIPYDEDLIPC